MADNAEVGRWRWRMRASIAIFVASVLLLIAFGASDFEGAVGWLILLGAASFAATLYTAWKYQQAFIDNAVANGMTEEEAQASWYKMYPNTD